jgi:hypothetical protein
MGGLGNQMFQYAFARAFVLKKGVILKRGFNYDFSWFIKAEQDKLNDIQSDHIKFSHDGIKLDNFNIKYPCNFKYNLLNRLKYKISKYKSRRYTRIVDESAIFHEKIHQKNLFFTYSKYRLLAQFHYIYAKGITLHMIHVKQSMQIWKVIIIKKQ